MNQLFYDIIFQPDRKFVFSRDLFADIMSVHNRNMKYTRAIEFDYTNLLASKVIVVIVRRLDMLVTPAS